MYEIKRLVQDLTSENEVGEAELEEHLNDGWEIVNISTVAGGHNKDDGFYRQYITQVILLRRKVVERGSDDEIGLW